MEQIAPVECIANDVAHILGSECQSLTRLDTEDVNDWGVITGHTLTLEDGQEHALYVAPAPISNAPQLDTEAALTFVDPDTGTTTLAWLYPNDPALPALRRCVFVDEVTSILRTLQDGGAATLGTITDLTLVGYRPGKRAVLRVTIASSIPGPDEPQDKAVYLKIVRPSVAESLAARHETLRAVGVPVPEILAWSPEGLLVFRALSGHPLSVLEIDETTAHTPLPHTLTRILADTLAMLSRIPRDETTSTKPPVTRASVQYVSRIDTFDEHLGGLARELSSAIARQLAAADATRPERVPIHGDLHSEQIFVDEAGQLTGILDIERLALGVVEDDLAVFIAHELVRQIAFDLTPAEEAAAQRRIDTARQHAGNDSILPRTAAVLIAHAAGFAAEDDADTVMKLLGCATYLVEDAEECSGEHVKSAFVTVKLSDEKSLTPLSHRSHEGI